MEINFNLEPEKLIEELNQRLGSFKESRLRLSQEIAAIGVVLDECIQSTEILPERLRALRAAPSIDTEKTTGAGLPGQPALASGPAMSLEDFKGYIEKLLQGSVEAVGDKVSNKIAAMLKDLRSLSGAAREAKIQQIQDAAISESVDLSSLFKHEQENVQSNLGELGVEEKESKGIDSSIEKLRKMREKKG